jgi:uncharacterized protein
MNEKTIKKLKDIFLKQPVVTLYLFGSQANDKATKLSDYDFAVQVNKTVRPDDYFDLKLKLMGEICDVLRSDKVDVVIVNSELTPLSLRFRIIKDGKILYCQDDILRSRMEVRVMNEYFDRKYYLDRHVAGSLARFAVKGFSL